MELSLAPSAVQNDCGAAGVVEQRNTYLGQILRSTLNGSRRIMLLDTNFRIALYLSGLFVAPLVGKFLPSFECCSFCSALSEWFNSFFVEMAWEWSLLLAVPFVLLESYVLSGGDIKKPLKCQLPRVFVTTCSWLVCLKVFKLIEQGSLSGCPVMGLFMKCHCRRRCCIVSNGLRISDHTFILIQSSLMLVEEARALLSFEAVKLQLHEELYNRRSGEYSATNILCDFDDDQLKKMRSLYRFLEPVVHLLFLCMSMLQLSWDAMLFTTMLYYHSMVEKVLGGVTAMLMWALIYRFWYNTTSLDDLLDGQAFPVHRDMYDSAALLDLYPNTLEEHGANVTDISVNNYIPNCDGSPVVASSEPQRIFGSFSLHESFTEPITEPFTQDTFQSTSESARQRTRKAGIAQSAAFCDVFTVNSYPRNADHPTSGNQASGNIEPRLTFCRAAKDTNSLKAGADVGHPKKKSSADSRNSSSEDTFFSLHSSSESNAAKEEDSGTKLRALPKEESYPDTRYQPEETSYEYASESYIDYSKRSKVPPPKPPRLNPPQTTELAVEDSFTDDYQRSKVPPPKPPRTYQTDMVEGSDPELILTGSFIDYYERSKVPSPKPPRLNPSEKAEFVAEDYRDNYQKSKVPPPKPPRTYQTDAVRDSDSELFTMDGYRAYYQKSMTPPPKPPRLNAPEKVRFAEKDDDYYRKAEDTAWLNSLEEDDRQTESERTCNCFSWCGKY